MSVAVSISPAEAAEIYASMWHADNEGGFPDPGAVQWHEASDATPPAEQVPEDLAVRGYSLAQLPAQALLETVGRIRQSGLWLPRTGHHNLQSLYAANARYFDPELVDSYRALTGQSPSEAQINHYDGGIDGAYMSMHVDRATLPAVMAAHLGGACLTIVQSRPDSEEYNGYRFDTPGQTVVFNNQARVRHGVMVPPDSQRTSAVLYTIEQPDNLIWAKP